MSEQKSCPNCNIYNSFQAKKCKNCGHDLGIGSIVPDEKLVEGLIKDHKYSVSPEILVPKVGAYLVEKGDITEGDLREALAFQKEKNSLNTPILLGQALVELKIIDREELDLAVTEQIYDLQNALKDSNLMLEQRVDDRTSELRKALEQLSEMNQLKSNFISNISHEFKTPLSHMIGYIELLQGEVLGPLAGEQKRALEVINKSYDRLFSLIDNLIQFSLISQKKISLEKSEVQLSKLIKKGIAGLGKKEKRKNIQLNYKNCADNIYVIADQEKITWVIGQILENAIKFNQEAGNVFLDTSILDNKISISVQDTGVGLAEEEMKKIFEAFHQLDSSATREYDGTGIGLSLARQILVAHDSDIKVSSEVGKGSIFKFSLPYTIK
ncbi:MAG: hypothetical protein HON98_07250 [Chloroflexi bacterium]|jgi:signal transduction histidine kinase|nr:hypothetical protein [Chloroflexota bacterium]MBT3669739.1 hypothetical protein [Chloroflexota bacterium]MBT4003429.1 hypothetical protein [Chloroflexota bacterium]MBT4305219.1 hypothetical protein [Chloroflexota bacterium]MBT4534858.1 hypothetical protein [Chloroflexota bacterium]